MPNELFNNLLVVIDDINIVAGINHYAFRGSDCNSLSIQIKTGNIGVRILCSNIKAPGAFGWTDITSSLSTAFTGNDLVILRDIKALWWQIRYERTNANNYAKIHILKY